MISLSRFFHSVSLVLFFLTVLPSRAAEFDLVGREMIRILQNGHYARLPFNEELSARFFERYLETLDGDRVYFLASEVDEFKRRYERSLHDRLSTRTFMPIARGLYEVYRSRVSGRVSYVAELLERGQFDFTKERKITRDRGELEWPVDGSALQQVWRDLLEEMILSERIKRKRLRARAKRVGRPDPFRSEPSIKKKVALQFDRLFKTVAKTSEEDIANYFLSAVANAYDPHSEYYSETELEQFKIDVSNELVGIGARLSMNDFGEAEIYGIVNGGPADQQGELKLGDRLVAISPQGDGRWVDIMFKPIDKVIEHILGEDELPVGLRVKRSVKLDDEEGEGEDVVLEITVPRGVVTIKDDLASAKIYEYGSEDEMIRLGVITIPSFYFDYDGVGSRVSVDVERLLARLKDEEVDGLALDLRDNAGGSLPEVQRLTGFFISRGPVVQVKSINGQVRSLNSFHRKPLYHGPLVVLTNRGSASATEILAGALQDYNRAVIVGSAATYGKGTVQKVVDLADVMPVFSDRARVGSLKLTFQKYYRVSGSSVQIKGVTPDLIFPDINDAYEVGEGFQKYALPHDVIRGSSRLKPWDRDELYLDFLKERSEQRLEQVHYFQYLRSDIARARAEVAKNEISLNLKARLEQVEREERLRESRNEERRRRFAQMEEEDERTLQVFRLSLDDLSREELRPFDQDDHSEDYIREAVDELAELEKALKWPSGIDAIKRETLLILGDLVRATTAANLATIEKDE